MESAQVSQLTILNMVVRLYLKKQICLQKIQEGDFQLFYEIDLFPAALIRKWHPAHVAVFHNGQVIITGVKTMEQVNNIVQDLTSFLSHLAC